MATTSTPLFAVVGVTDLAVERVRAAAANASAVQAQFEAKVSAVSAILQFGVWWITAKKPQRQLFALLDEWQFQRPIGVAFETTV